MGDKINKFLQGKKKYSVFIITVLTSAISMLVSDPQAQQELQEFVPTLAMLLSGIVYLVVEGWNDTKRFQAEEAYYNMLVTSGQRTTTQPAAPQAADQPSTTVIGTQEPFDEAEFIRQVHTSAQELAKKAFPDDPSHPANIYRAAELVGRKLECTDIRQALAYWEYLAGLAEDVWKKLEFDTRDERGCKLHPPELYEFRATTKRVATCLADLAELAKTDYDWRRLGSPPYGTTVYSVGAFAGEVVERKK